MSRRLALLWPWAAALLASMPLSFSQAAAGIAQTRDFQVNDFDHLVVALPADVKVLPGKSASITVTAEPKVLDVISVTQSDGQVRITTTGSFQTQDEVSVSVSTPNLRALDVSEAGDVAVSGPLGSVLTLKVEDASSVSLNKMNLKALDADLSGSAEITANGQSGKLQLTAVDASSFDGSSLKLKDARMAVSGASEASVFASSTLSVKITETGSVYYSGSPSIEQSVSFAGTLEAQ
ncbi:MAG: head GIN domain-containing protein [Burkholderiaceae bacterium]